MYMEPPFWEPFPRIQPVHCVHPLSPVQAGKARKIIFRSIPRRLSFFHPSFLWFYPFGCYSFSVVI